MPPATQRVAAYGLVVVDGSVLLCRASALTEVPGWWWLPGGGVDFGEHPRETVCREFAEETGLSVTVGPLLGVLSDVRGRRSGEQVHSLRLLYRIETITGNLRPEVGGTTDLAAFHRLEDVGQLQLARYVTEALELFGP